MVAQCNFALRKSECTLETCCLAQSSFLYIPNFGANLFFVIFFAVFILPQLGLAWKTRTWGFGVSVAIGLVMEVVGYVGRLMLNDNPFDDSGFLIYLIFLTIAPVFITAGIYLTLSRLVVLYGEHLSFFKPRTIALTFMASDFTSLVLQAAGGGIAQTADDDNDSETKQTGVDIMIAGLVLQVVSLCVFLGYMTYFYWRCRTGVLNMNSDKSACRNRTIFKVFLVNLVIAVLVILARSLFRVIELWQGFEGDLWNSETDFLVLDGALMGLSVVLLTVSQPGIAFGKQWNECNWTLRTPKPATKSDDIELEK